MQILMLVKKIEILKIFLEKLVYLYDCFHVVCKPCLAKKINSEFLKSGTLACNECKV